MDEIQKIVFEIADRCARRKVPVTDMLAAFVAKVFPHPPLSFSSAATFPRHFPHSVRAGWRFQRETGTDPDAFRKNCALSVPPQMCP